MIAAMEETERQTEDAEPRWKTAGPPYFLTRDELLAELHARGYSMTERQLKSWGSYGIVPVPVRRMPTGATKRVARVLYPVWMVRVISELFDNITSGATRDQLRELAPRIIKQWEGSENNLSSMSFTYALSGSAAGTSTASGTLAVSIALTGASTGTSTVEGTATLTVRGTVLPRVTRALQRAAWEYAADYIEKNGMPVSAVTLTLHLEDQTGVSIEVRLPPSMDD